MVAAARRREAAAFIRAWPTCRACRRLWRLVMLMICGEALLDVFQGEETRTGMTLDANVGGSRTGAGPGALTKVMSVIEQAKKKRQMTPISTGLTA